MKCVQLYSLFHHGRKFFLCTNHFQSILARGTDLKDLRVSVHFILLHLQYIKALLPPGSDGPALDLAQTKFLFLLLSTVHNYFLTGIF